METNVSTTPVPSPSPGILSTKIPSTVVFAIGILLFLMPFAELKCNQSDTKTDMGGFSLNLGAQTTISNTGVGLAFGSEWKIAVNGLGGMLSGNDSNMNKEQPKQDPNYYAIAALALGVIGLVFCFVKMNGASWIGMLAGVLSAVALIGLRFDLDKKVKEPSQVVEENDHTSNWLSGGVDAVKFELSYTSWYYIAVLAMLAAAVLCYLRIKNSKVV
ncbi:MAG: hypothetical protein E6H07_07075 [Bacteroidetes bacterium]|nr:MAG: hypothetical protein E6H07_07075 [Bacteroidota bacterium]